MFQLSLRSHSPQAPEGSATLAEIPKRFVGGPFKFRTLRNATTRPAAVAIPTTKLGGCAGPPPTDDVDRKQAQNLGPSARNRHRKFRETPHNSGPGLGGTEEVDSSAAGVERPWRPDRQPSGRRAYFSYGRGGQHRTRPRPEQRPKREDCAPVADRTSVAPDEALSRDGRAEGPGTHRQWEATSSSTEEQSEPWNGVSRPRGGRRHGGRGGWALGKRQQQNLRSQAPPGIVSGTEDR